MFSSFDSLVRRLTPVVVSTPAASLHLSRYFLARSGVLTLAFTGFPLPLLDLKRRILEIIPDLPPERSGSRWPKVTLGALRTDEPLTEDEVARLRDLCNRADRDLRNAPLIRAHEALLIEYRCRSLEHRTHAIQLPFHGDWRREDDRVPIEHAHIVRDTLRQFARERHDRYYPDIIRSGNRESHYRNTQHGCTLVSPLPPVVPGIDDFVRAVEEALPGRYAWFTPASRHVTIRALGPEALR